jgi:hypothetical protein
VGYFKSDEWKHIFRVLADWREAAKWYVGDREPPPKGFGAWTHELVEFCDAHTSIDSAPLWELYCHATNFVVTTGKNRNPQQEVLDLLAAKVIGILNRLEALGIVSDDPGAKTQSQRTADSKSDSKKKSPPKLPQSVDVHELCRMLQEGLPKGQSMNEIARGFTHETNDKAPKSESLLRQCRRYRHLWDPKAT